jgi:hypothetical protein
LIVLDFDSEYWTILYIVNLTLIYTLANAVLTTLGPSCLLDLPTNLQGIEKSDLLMTSSLMPHQPLREWRSGREGGQCGFGGNMKQGSLSSEMGYKASCHQFLVLSYISLHHVRERLFRLPQLE